MDKMFQLEELPDDLDLIKMFKSKKILSTLPYEKDPLWNQLIMNLKLKPTHNLDKFISFFEILYRIKKIITTYLNGKFDLVIVTGGEKSDLIYLIFASLCFWKKTPHIIGVAEWSIPKSRMKKSVKKIYFYLTNRIVVQIQALSKEEVFFYSEAFGIPTKKFVVIPFSTTLIGYNFLQKNRNFLLSGGSSYRDYETLIDAAKKFPIPLEIGLPKGSNLISKESIGKDSNIIVHSGLTRAEFIEKTSECTLFLLSVSPDLKRSVGDQSILNAMYYGKIVIATDSIGPRNYIKNGVNGFLVPESNADAWVNVVNHVLNLDVNDYKRITSNAIYTAQVIFSEKNRIKRVLMAASIFL